MTATTLALSFLTACAVLFAAGEMFGLWRVMRVSAAVCLVLMGFALSGAGR